METITDKVPNSLFSESLHRRHKLIVRALFKAVVKVCSIKEKNFNVTGVKLFNGLTYSKRSLWNVSLKC